MIMFSLILLSLGLAMDAFAAAVAQGASSRPSRSMALRMSLAFGLAQAIMPLLVVAIATSIDAAIAGITLPSIGAPIILACAVIGLTTALLTWPGVYLGALVGARIGKWAEVLGGLILIGLGIKIFVVQQFFGTSV